MVKLYLNYFPHSKMAISEHKNGHFEEIRGWLQILELGSNSTIFHLLFDTYDSPGAVFIWKWEKYRPYLLVCLRWGHGWGHGSSQIGFLFLNYQKKNHVPYSNVTMLSVAFFFLELQKIIHTCTLDILLGQPIKLIQVASIRIAWNCSLPRAMR